MTETVDAPVRAAPTAADYLLVLLICAAAAIAAVLEVFLVPLYVGGTIFPVTVALSAATMWALPRLGSWLTRNATGAVLPVAAWLVVVLVLGFVARPEGDVVVQGGNSEQWVMFAMVLAGAIVGFSTAMRTNVSR